MPRANRYILPGYTYHLTHRCHNRSFLFRFARDRTEYRKRLRECVRQFGVSMLTYCITSNHTHLLVRAQDSTTVSAVMQKLEGEFAEYYNIRKRRSGAFWGGRYHCTMIDGGQHLRNCMRYIDLNMVRAGVVEHPAEWPWCGFPELTGLRRRYRLLDREQVLMLYGGRDPADFASKYGSAIAERLRRGALQRQPMWTESIAVGSESFVRQIEEQTDRRLRMDVDMGCSGAWTLRESAPTYG